MAILIAGGANLTLSTSLQSAMTSEGPCLTVDIDVTAILSAAAAAEQRLDWAAAANLYARLREHFPNNSAAHLGNSRVLTELGRRAEADALLTAALLRFPENFQIRFDHARLAQTREESLRRWAALVDLYPDRPGGVTAYLTALREEGALDVAEARAAAAVEAFPAAAGIGIEWARIAAARADRPEAVRRWETVRARFPTNTTAVAGHAAALVAANRPDEADAVLRDGVARFPDRLDLASDYARLAQSRQDWAEVLRRWEEVRTRFPDRPAGYAGVAEALGYLRRADEAEALLLEVASRFPTSRDILFALARAAHARQDWETAIARWEQVRAVLPDAHTPLVELSHTLISARRHDEADGLLKAALDRFPDQFDLMLQQASLALHQNNLVLSQERWSRLLQRFPNDARVLFGLAQVLITQGQYDAAAPLLDRFLALRPDHAQAMAERARVDLRRGDWRSALDRLLAASRRFPDNGAIDALITETKVAAMLADPDFVDEADLERAALVIASEVQSGGNEARRLRSLMLTFESIGDNCEFGLVQRYFGAEPISLLRWAGLSPGELTRGLQARFEGVGEAAQTILLVRGDEYFTRDRRYRMPMHTFINPNEITYDELFPKLCARLKLMRRKLLEHLNGGHKILIYKCVEGLRDEHIAQITAALGAYGPNRILFVRPADANHPAERVEQRGPDVAVGYISRLGHDPKIGWNIDFRGWLRLCEQASVLLQREPRLARAS
jgi:tetratricopeptide (TPR) repeat protein